GFLIMRGLRNLAGSSPGIHPGILDPVSGVRRALILISDPGPVFINAAEPAPDARSPHALLRLKLPEMQCNPATICLPPSSPLWLREATTLSWPVCEGPFALAGTRPPKNKRSGPS